MKSFKMKMMMTAAASLALLAAACGSAPAPQPQRSSAPQQDTPMLSQTEAASRAAEKTAPPSVTLDWKDRELGQIASPDWLLPAIDGRFKIFKANWEITGDKVLKVGRPGRASNLRAAQTNADMGYITEIAYSLRQTVNAKMGNSDLDDGGLVALNNAVREAKVVIAGQERLTDFWILREFTDSQGRTNKEYVCWVVYACDKDVWDKMVAKYLLDVVNNVPQQAAKQKLAGMFAEIAADSRSEKEKSEQVFRDEVRAQLQAIQKPMSESERLAAYRSGDSAKIAAADVTPADADYITMLAALAGVE